MALRTNVPDGGPRPIDRIIGPFQRFARIESAGGILLLTCAAVALVWANMAPEGYDHFWHQYVVVKLGDFELKLSYAHFVNDGLMAIFFFVVGLEIKREMIAGELASMRKAAIPIAAAIGGMVVPALIYVGINLGQPDNLKGWAIPMATDIAFALGIMAMLGRRVPVSLKVFLTALAIVDDIGAVLVIAFFYTDTIAMLSLFVALGVIALSACANWAGVRRPIVYGLLGLVMWVFLLESGVHATIGGVLLALTIPAKVRIDPASFTTFAEDAVERFKAAGDDDEILTNQRRQSALYGLEHASERAQTPLNRLEHGMHPVVSFLIMPIFALSQAGIVLVGGDTGVGELLSSGVCLGVILGLFVGKPVGVLLAVWIAIRAGLGDKPAGATYKHLLGTGLLAGIGFTMSLFIANLAFREGDMLLIAKLGIFLGSIVSGVAGFIVLRAASSAPTNE